MRNILPQQIINNNDNIPRKLEIQRRFNHDFNHDVHQDFNNVYYNNDDDNNSNNSSITEPSAQVIKYNNQYINTSYRTTSNPNYSSNKKEKDNYNCKKDSIFRNIINKPSKKPIIAITTSDLQRQIQELEHHQSHAHDHVISRNNTSSTITTTLSLSELLPNRTLSSSSKDTDSLSNFLRNETMTSGTTIDDNVIDMHSSSRNDISSSSRKQQKQKEVDDNNRTQMDSSYYSFDDSITCKGKIDIPTKPFFWRSYPAMHDATTNSDNNKSHSDEIKEENNKIMHAQNKNKAEVKVKEEEENDDNLLSFIESYGWKFQQDICL